MVNAVCDHGIPVTVTCGHCLAAGRILQLESAIKWVLNDAKYKAPEQLDSFLVGSWMARLNMVLTTPVDGRAES